MVTPRIERYVRRRFDAENAERVLRTLTAWRLPYQDEPPSERLVAAVVLFADGRLMRVEDALDLADTDGRDLLVAADLADADWPRRLDARLGPPGG